MERDRPRPVVGRAPTMAGDLDGEHGGTADRHKVAIRPGFARHAGEHPWRRGPPHRRGRRGCGAPWRPADPGAGGTGRTAGGADPGYGESVRDRRAARGCAPCGGAGTSRPSSPAAVGLRLQPVASDATLPRGTGRGPGDRDRSGVQRAWGL